MKNKITIEIETELTTQEELRDLTEYIRRQLISSNLNVNSIDLGSQNGKGRRR